MRYFLAKTEPQVYSIDDFRRDKRTIWDGIKNPQALRAIRSMEAGDRVFIYHSGGEPGIAGLGRAASGPRDDAKDARLAVVDLEYVAHLTPSTSLAEVKKSGLFDEWALVRQSRLSTMEVPEEFVVWIRKRYPDVEI